MLKINKQTITLTKGDDASLRLVPRYKDRTEYVLTERDSAVFRIKFGHTLVELECTLNLETNKIVANITPNDTKDFNPGIYRYEAELITSFGFHYTFIADQTFILGQEYEQRITSTSNGNSSAVGGNLPEIDGVVDGEPVVYGDIQPTNPMMDYDELNHLPKLNGKTIKGDHDSEYYGIATKTSELENDSDFVSDDEYVHTDNNYDDTAKDKVDALGTASTYDVPESGNAGTSQVVKGDDTRLTDNRNPNSHTHSKADITDFPTNVSAFNNDSGFITNTVNNLANYYLKTQTYTQTEVDNLISAAVSGRFQKVNALPASGQPNVIYLVPKADPETSNTCDEYIWQDNAWELIGSTDVDLSDYVTDDDLTTALQSYLTTSAFNTAITSYYTKTETDNLLANKVDKVAGKGLSTNDYDNTAKGIVDGVTSALNDKVDKVQGKGLSTNDYDNTAKGIVDGVTSALADKVDKVNGKGLSTEDYTTAEKSKLGDISDNAKKVASSTTNGHIEIDDVDTTVYDDTAVTTAIENIEDELSTDSATVEGNPINFSTKSAQNAESTIIDLEPIQDLHGYDKPWVGGADVNLFRPGEVKTYTESGITFTSDGNGRYTIKGTASASVECYFSCEEYSFPDGSTHTLGFMNSQASPQGQGMDFNFYNGSTKQDGWGLNQVNRSYHGYSQMSNKTVNKYGIHIASGIVVDMTLSPFVIAGESPMTAFRPYTNLCPITGRTEIGILGCGINLIPDGTDTSNGYIDNYYLKSDGTTVYTTVANYVSEYFRVNGNSVYTLFDKNHIANASAICFYDANKNYITGVAIERTTKNITTPQNAVYARCTQFKDTSSLVQFEVGSTTHEAKAYHKETDLTISLGQTVYGGQLDVENGVLVAFPRFLDLGDLTWEVRESVTARANLPANAKFISQGTKVNAISSRYEICPQSEITQHNACITFNSAVQIYVRDTTASFTTPESVQQYLSGAELCYELATPITINLTPHTIKLLEGVNNISTDGDKITLTYRDGSVATLGDLTSAVDSLDSKIDDSKILTDTVTGDKYILVVTNGVLSIEQISN